MNFEDNDSGPVTVLDLARFRGVEPDEQGGITLGQVKAVGLPFFGGCCVCGASVACYNSCPSRSGYLKCRSGCIGDDGFETADDANRFLFPDEYEWKGVQK